MSERGAWAVLGVLTAILLVACALARLDRLTGGQFWSDGATYYSAAWSLAEDGDLVYGYDARDVLRVRREFPVGPQGIFLKRASGGFVVDGAAGFPWVRRLRPDEPRVYFAKAFAYPVAAAPAVKILGTSGLLVTNAVALAAALWGGFAVLRRRGFGPGSALLTALAIFLATVAPIYVLWPTPEMFNVGLIAAGLWAWSARRPMLSAVLLGIVTYSKPYNLFLALPLGVEPLLDTSVAWWPRWRESLRRGLVMGGVIVALFAVNAAVTGELNYQGGERKTCYAPFPYETPGVTFGNSCIWMTTNQAGPGVEGEDEQRRGEGVLRAPGEIRDSFVRNLGYFWIGRYGGAVPYYAPAVLALILFLIKGPRDRTGWLAAAALAVSWVFYIRMIPDNWYGGGGTVGNRYFLNLLPLAVFLVPVGRTLWVVAGGLLGVALFLWPVLLHPMHHALHPGEHAMRAPFRALPAELTMLNDLSVFTDASRKKRPVGDTEGDPHKHWPADPKAYYLYFSDRGTWGLEEGGGFRVRAGASAEVILRALEPVKSMTFEVTGGSAPDTVRIAVGRAKGEADVRPGETKRVVLTPGAGFAYYDTFLLVLRLESRAAPSDDQMRAALVRIVLDVDKRPPRR